MALVVGRWSAMFSVVFMFTLFGVFGTSIIAFAKQSGTPTPLLSCQRAWQEDSASSTATLTVDCMTDRALTVADGWTLDGDGHTIFVVDPAGSLFRGGVIDVRGGTFTVRNVTVDGSGLTPGCSPETAVAGVLFLAASGAVEASTCTNIARGEGYRCGYGIIVAESSAAPVAITRNVIHGPGDGGVFVAGATAKVTSNVITDAGGNGIAFGAPGSSGMITGNTIRNAGYAGITIEDQADVTLSGNTIVDSTQFGILAFTGATVKIVEKNQISGAEAGIVISDPETRAELFDDDIKRTRKDGLYIQNGARVTATYLRITPSSGSGITVLHQGSRATIGHNTIAAATTATAIVVRDGATADTIGNIVHGPGSASVDSLFGPFGIRYMSGAAGVIRQNRVSGYLSDAPGSRACGIAIDLDAGAVQLGENTYPPPGNTTNLCSGTPPEGWDISNPGATPAATPAP